MSKEVKAAIIGGIFVVIAACISLLVPIIEQLVTPTPTIESSPSPPTATLTQTSIPPTETPIPPTGTPATPSTVTLTQTSIPPTETPIPPTSTPTTPTPAFDVFDDFLSALGDNWGDIEGDISPIVLDGSLRLNYTSSGGYGGGGIHINNNDTPLKLVATELVVNDAKAKSYTFIQVFLGIIDSKPWYANFGIMHTGELFYASAPVGESPKGIEETWSSKGLGNPNVLVVEWIGEDVFFYANNQLLHEVKAKDGGWWVIFGVGAEGNGSSTNKFNWAGWSYRR